MSKPTFVGNRRVVSSFSVLQAVANDLNQIKKEDGLTLDDLGRVLGVTGEQASKYCDGTAAMKITAWAFARTAWNGRFSGSLDNLVSDARGETPTTDRAKSTCVLQAALALSKALEDDDEIDGVEVHQNRKILEAGRDAIDALLAKPLMKGVA